MPSLPPPQQPPPLVGFSAGVVVVAEGARVTLRTCDWCAAAVMVDPRDTHDRLKEHSEWHLRQRRGWPV